MDNQNGSETIGRRDKGIHRGGLHLLEGEKGLRHTGIWCRYHSKKGLRETKITMYWSIFTTGTDTDAIIAYLVPGRNDFLIS